MGYFITKGIFVRDIFLPLPFSRILLHAPSTIISFSGSDELKKFVEISGNSYLTTHRLIFLTKGSKSNLKSFSLPFCVLSEVDIEQVNIQNTIHKWYYVIRVEEIGRTLMAMAFLLHVFIAGFWSKLPEGESSCSAQWKLERRS